MKNRKQQAFTLVELMIALTITLMVIGGVSSSFLVFVKSTMSLANYSDMNSQSRTFLERFGREIRMADEVWIADTDQVSIEIPTAGGTETIDYIYQPANKRIVREVDAVQIPVLKNIESMNLTYFNLTGNVTTNLLEVKKIQLEASLMKNVLYIKNTNQIVSARFLMRNRTVSN